MVCSTVCSGAYQSKHESSASLALVRGIHRWPVNSPHKWPVTRKMSPFDDVIMTQQNCERVQNNFNEMEKIKYNAQVKHKLNMFLMHLDTSHQWFPRYNPIKSLAVFLFPPITSLQNYAHATTVCLQIYVTRTQRKFRMPSMKLHHSAHATTA